MDKESQPDSLPTIPMKPDYAPSEVYSSEPPPAYHRPKAASVQIAKIVSATIVLVALILGGCMLASAYITANASCRQLEQELQLLTETADRMQPLQPEALVQEDPRLNQTTESSKVEELRNKMKEIEDNSVAEDDDSNEDDSEEAEKITPVHIKLPLHLDFDEITGAMLDKNQRSKMNCVVEKKHAEEVVEHKPKTVALPFGVNLTTDPRVERVTGERMVIICESGSMQRQHMQPPQPEEQEDTIMVQPVVIPIGPINPYQTHMPQQMRPPLPIQIRPVESLRPPMPPPMNQVQNPPNPFIHNIIQQLIAQRIRAEMLRAAAQEEPQKESAEVPQRFPVPEELMRQINREVPQRQMAIPDELLRQINRAEVPQRQIPIPEELLRQINRLPANEVVISVSEQETEEPPQELRVVQHPRQGAQEMNGRQTYARGIPVHIPVPMMQQQVEPQEQEPQASASGSSEELRPHYVQPRSVRSVDAVLAREKRTKRCACDCAC